MKTKNVITESFFSSKKLETNMKSPKRYLSKQIGTPYELKSGGLRLDQICFLLSDVEQILLSQSKHCNAKLIQENKIYIPGSNEALSELLNYTDDAIVKNLFHSRGIVLSDAIGKMEERQEIIHCIGEPELKKACKLIEVRTNVSFFQKYWRMLPEGQRQGEIADDDFEALCSELKIPRRTREIIKRKKANKQAESIIHIDIVANNPHEENGN